MQWDVEPVAAQMSQMAEDLTARINALDPESESPVFSDFNFVITTGDWELTNGLYKARVNNTVLLTATAGIQVFYDASLRTALVGDIYEDKQTGYIDFYTTIMPTGSVSGIVRVIDSTGGNVQVQRGGTGASTPKGARENLNTPIRDIPINFGTVSSLPQTIYDADLTANMIACDAAFSNPAAVPGGIDVTFAAGSVTITGTLVSGAETTISFWAHEQRSAVEGTETPSEQQRITEFVQVQAQTLSSAQQTQVRQNIGAADASILSEFITKQTAHVEKDLLQNKNDWTPIPDFTKTVVDSYRWITFYGVIPNTMVGNVSHILTTKIYNSTEQRVYVTDGEVYVALKYVADVLNYKVVGASVVNVTVMLDELL